VPHLNAGIAGAESTQTRPMNCHSVLGSKDCQLAAFHGRMNAVYRNACVSKTKVVEWYQKFQSELQKISNKV
jgi:hypothetical protein